MDWVVSWNKRYERVPEDMRFGLVVSFVVLVGMINMLLTISTGFPFGLLVLLAILLIAGVRFAYILEAPAEVRGETTEPAKLQADWVVGLNRWYDGLPEDRQFWVLPAILIVAGFVNMMLTLAHAFPFALLFLLVLLALVAIRLPYLRGWLREPPSLSLAGAPSAHAVEHAATLPAPAMDETQAASRAAPADIVPPTED